MTGAIACTDGGDGTLADRMQEQTALPRPPYLSDAWLRDRGVDDPAALVGALRPESEVMRPERLRAIKATRLSFVTSLVRRMVAQRWRVKLSRKELDGSGQGFLLYDIEAEGRQFHFAVASRPVGEEERLGRFYETEFDFYGSLLDGPADVDRAQQEVAGMASALWKGRTDNRSFGWTIANRSQRHFAHTLDSLTAARQPDRALLAAGGGYILRNAGWYGNGRQGCRSWLSLDAGHPLGGPYAVDVFALYLWRIAAIDIVETMARARNPDAPALDTAIRRSLGIGNASGMGMIAALVRWPAWLSSYNFARELALAYGMTRRGPVEPARARRVQELLGRASRYFAAQPAVNVAEIEQPAHLSKLLAAILPAATELADKGTVRGCLPQYPWAALAAEAAKLGSRELSEQVNSLVIEAEHEFADAAAGLIAVGMSTPRRVRPCMDVGRLKELIRARYGWALDIDLTTPASRAYFWYRSEENAENRRGERAIDAGVENETFVDVAGAVQALSHALAGAADELSVGRFLLTSPWHSHTVSRVQLSASLPYSEIRGNVIDRNFLPLDGIRFLLSTLGLEGAHPHSTRWVRGVFLQGAPLPEEIAAGEGEDWLFSPAPEIGAG